jgi:CubicO group peptidase (beta-lactamase class C family)
MAEIHGFCGWADLDKTQAWQQDTIVPVASATKVMATLVGLMMVDRGLIVPVARYWPEFAEGVIDPRQSPIGRALYKLLPSL